MRRIGDIIARCVAVLIAIPILLAGAVLICANTDPGRRLIEAATEWATAGTVRIERIAGRFPDAIRIGRVRVADEAGVWVTVEDAALDWSPRRLIAREVSIERLEARSVALDRLPGSKSSASSGGTSIPELRVTLSRLHVERFTAGAAIAGQSVALAIGGSGKIALPDTGDAQLTVTSLEPREGSNRPGGAGQDADHPPPDRYTVELSMDPSRLHATLAVTEGAKGLIAGIAGLPDLGAITVRASTDGPIGALATEAVVEAGPLRAEVSGTVDGTARAADLIFSATAPAMTPAPDIAWSSIRLEGTLHGKFSAPEAAATLTADGITAAGAALGSLHATLSGDATGKTELHARLDGLRVPGPSPDLLAGEPLTLDATARLDDAKFPAQFILRHALFSAEGAADTGQAQIRLTVPDLTPFAAIGGVDLKGQTTLDFGAVRSGDGFDLTLKGSVAVAGGLNPVPSLVGDAGTIDMAASLRGDDVTLTRLSVNGTAFNVTANGSFTQRRVDADWTFSIPDLGAIRPGASGTISGRGHAGGSPSSLSVTCDLTGDAAGEGGRLEQFTAHLNVDGLPDAPSARLTAGGTILDAPLTVEIGAEQRGGGFHLAIDRFAWKSLATNGTLDLPPGATLPTGKITLAMARIADLAPLVGRQVAGSVTASVDAAPDATRINVSVTGAAMPGVATIGKTALEATVTDPAGQPAIDGTLTMDGVDASGQAGSGRVTAKGSLDAMALGLNASATIPRLGPARVETSGTLNATAKTFTLALAQITWGKEAIRLLAPARIAFTRGVAVDGLKLGFRQAQLTVAGRVGAGAGEAGRGGPGAPADALDLRANLLNLPADVIAIVSPEYAADGTIAGEARLTGSVARPGGTIRLGASRIRMRNGPGRALPAADLTFSATLGGPQARLDAKLTAGGSSLTLTGPVATDFVGKMDLHAGGSVDLAMLNPFLAGQGRNARGRLDLALGIGGTPAAPVMSGTVRVTNGDVQDAGLGAHLSEIAAVVRADGDTIRIERFDAKAGPGTVSASGTVGLAGIRQLDLTLRASNARVLSSDLATAWIDANLTLRGPMASGPALGGTLLVRKADIQVPEKLPPSIAFLPVRDANAPPVPPPPPASVPDITLDLTLNAPEQVYIRGRGIDVELGGRVAFTGTASRPVPHGGLHLRRGTFSLAGTSLNLTEGTIDFTGGGLTNPQLKLVATSVSATFTSTLTISGDVRNPKIALSSVPELPQDEILSQLLFKTSRTRLSPFQLAQIAAALASIAGVDSPVGDPLAGMRTRLGLDQLSVGSNAKGGATLEAGRYLAPGVRLGAKQGVTGGETQATVQIDIAKGLKLETTAGTGSTSATGAGGSGGGASVGVTYQFEY